MAPGRQKLPEAVVIPSEVEGSVLSPFNDGTRILNGDHAEKAGSFGAGGEIS